MPSVQYKGRLAEILIFGRDPQKKFPMSVVSKSQQTKRSYVKLCPEKQRKKKDFMHNVLMQSLEAEIKATLPKMPS